MDLESFKKDWKAQTPTPHEPDLKAMLRKSSGDALSSIRKNMYLEIGLITILSLSLILYEAFTSRDQPAGLAADDSFVYTLFGVFLALGFLYFFRVLSIVNRTRHTQATVSSLTNAIIQLERAIEIYKTFNVALIPIAIILGLSITGTGFANLLFEGSLLYLPLTFVLTIITGYFVTEFWARHRFGKHIEKLRQNLSDLLEA